VSDLHDEDIEPEGEPGAAEATEDASLELKRPDPRLRPPDPAGTQPKWDPDELLPKETPRAAAGRLWAPAGEEAPEAGDPEARPAGVTATATATADAPAAPADADDDTPAYSRYSARFQFLLGALLAVGAAAVALLVVVAAGGGKDDNTIVLRNGPAWSSWRPTATGVEAAEQIAAHVGRQYRLPDGKQLVLATGSALQIFDMPVTIVIQKPVTQGGDIDVVDGVGVMYRLCGFSPNSTSTDCQIVAGKPSASRAMLLRREALELALYSFRYLGVSETVVLLPPTVDTNAPKATASATTTDSTVSTALLFQRSQPDVQRALAHPLGATLARKTPSVDSVTRSPDARLVRDLTQTKTYKFKFQESNQDARTYLLLAPILVR
jgi:hypothetical protein